MITQGSCVTYTRGPPQCPHVNAVCCSEPRVDFLLHQREINRFLGLPAELLTQGHGEW